MGDSPAAATAISAEPDPFWWWELPLVDVQAHVADKYGGYYPVIQFDKLAPHRSRRWPCLAVPAARLCFNCPKEDIDVFAVSFRALGNDPPSHELWRGMNGLSGALIERLFRFGRAENQTSATDGPEVTPTD